MWSPSPRCIAALVVSCITLSACSSTRSVYIAALDGEFRKQAATRLAVSIEVVQRNDRTPADPCRDAFKSAEVSASGTGFFFAATGGQAYLMTAGHVVAKNLGEKKAFCVRTPLLPGGTLEAQPLSRWAIRPLPGIDADILVIPDREFHHRLYWKVLSKAPPRLGETLQVFGSERAQQERIAIRLETADLRFCVDTPAHNSAPCDYPRIKMSGPGPKLPEKGDSGAPVFTAGWTLTGLYTQNDGRDDFQNGVFTAVRINDVLARAAESPEAGAVIPSLQPAEEPPSHTPYYVAGGLFGLGLGLGATAYGLRHEYYNNPTASLHGATLGLNIAADVSFAAALVVAGIQALLYRASNSEVRAYRTDWGL